MTTRLFIIAVIPTISIAYAVYLSDRYDREPISLLFKTFILGALSVIPTIVVERLFININIFSGILGMAYVSFIVAGFTEEYFKRLVVLKLIYHNKHFDEKLDGIVYCIFSALGFATVENVMYVVFRFSYNPYVGFYRGILSVPAHAIFAVTMGYYLSLAKFSKDGYRENEYMRKSFYIPVILHGLFNFILMIKTPILAGFIIPYVIYLWWSNQKKLDLYITESRIKNDERDGLE
ncbi:PrsW family intramembrane metalloprotease [Dethiothermospora halolimnae]|uniref:PrsW family intramembrane metalloprotease n=1 Tax=Dethiothermospora halolimnae TaxID=3114390 RepID=UPI003CCC19AE